MRCKLPEGWKKVRLGEISTLNTSNYRKEDNWRFVNYLDTGSITENIIDNINFISLDKDKLPSRAKRKVFKDDIIFSTVRPIQKHIGIIKEPLKNMLVSTGFAVITLDKTEVIPYYVYLYLAQEPVTNYLQSIAEQRVSTYPALNISDLKSLKINLPPLKEQKAIADTLSVLDDKIELNNKINKNLEQQAQAIFKHWFIDFEFPNEQGNPYKSSGGKMVESELGPIPKGWQVVELDNIISICNGKRPEEKHNNKNKECKYQILGASGVMGYTKDYLYNEPIIVIGRVGTHGVVQKINSKVWPSDNTMVIKTDHYEFVNQILLGLDYKSLNRGSTQPLLTQRDIKSQRAVIPYENAGILDFYEGIASKNRTKINILETQNQILSQLRDTLLPKLMSGEIRVPLSKK